MSLMSKSFFNNVYIYYYKNIEFHKENKFKTYIIFIEMREEERDRERERKDRQKQAQS